MLVLVIKVNWDLYKNNDIASVFYKDRQARNSEVVIRTPLAIGLKAWKNGVLWDGCVFATTNSVVGDISVSETID